MGENVSSNAIFQGAKSLEQRLALMHKAVDPLGFSSLVYDYTPIARTPDCQLIPPSVLKTVNLPESFELLWMEEDYFSIDLVQQICHTTSRPFTWSHLEGKSNIRGQIWGPEQQPVVRYMRDNSLRFGLTVPIHSPDGALSTVTGICIDPEHTFARNIRHNVAAFTLLALEMSESILEGLNRDEHGCRQIQLSAREIECLSLSAQGMTAKQIADHIKRALPTANFHLKNAINKLGARNRAQAVALAAHYRLLKY